MNAGKAKIDLHIYCERYKNVDILSEKQKSTKMLQKGIKRLVIGLFFFL